MLMDKIFISLDDLRNFNETFRKDMRYCFFAVRKCN